MILYLFCEHNRKLLVHAKLLTPNGYKHFTAGHLARFLIAVIKPFTRKVHLRKLRRPVIPVKGSVAVPEVFCKKVTKLAVLVSIRTAIQIFNP